MTVWDAIPENTNKVCEQYTRPTHNSSVHMVKGGLLVVLFHNYILNLEVVISKM